MHIFDGEFFYDCTVLVFKKDKEYDVFISCNIPYNFKIPKSRLHDIKDLKDFIKNNNKLIGFNNQYFDNPILEKIIRGLHKPEEIYKYSQSLINSKDRFRRDFWDNQLSFFYLDLLKINHYDNVNRATSLKKLEFNYRRKKIADLPFHHSKPVTKENQLESIVRYCIEDVDTTEMCFEKSKPAIKFRQSLSDKLDCMNMSDVAIGEELNAIEYCKITGIELNDLKRNKPTFNNLVIKFSDCIPDYINFKTKELQDLLKEIKTITVNKTKGYDKSFFIGDLEYTFGQGGIHSINYPQITKSDENYKIISVDVGSQYPSSIIKRKLYPRHLTESWSDNIKNTYNKRINEYKPLAKKDELMSALSEASKLQMNGGGYGKTNSEFSWQYDPQVTMSITLTCQLELLMLIEKMYINGIKCIMANTDGCEFYIERTQKEFFYSLCNDWEIETINNVYGRLEFIEYDFIAQLSVNDYIAKITSGGIKRKGSFMTYEDICSNNWHKDSSGMIIPLALENYFANGILVEETINNCNNIFEFCYGSKKQKAAKKGDFKWLISEVQDSGMVSSYLSEDRFIRYYIGGKTTINKLYEDHEIKNLPTKGEPVTVCQYLRKEDIISNGINNYPTLNKNFYIKEAKEIVTKIENYDN